MNSVVLIGPRCCGKTTTGKALSSYLHIPFIDADEVFISQYGSISNYTDSMGWSRFRQRETEILSTICAEYASQNIVLAPGGGAVSHNQGNKYRDENARLLNSFGSVVYILPSPDLEYSARILVPRFLNDVSSTGSRPPLTVVNDISQEVLSVLQERHPLYQRVADYTIYTWEKNPDQVALDIVRTVFPELLS